ncbi:universal stress protein [uncultured Winogradskyella sp.]|uniref:universal stress protein n=1 Tax=uncultured Winogradskyella sp. TaxID=395353 RepID=UPI0030D81899|tara:strand:+ start:100745 stop:101593 length:849 start_codon:yes stop_codon:yes gene_type:complete
MLSILLPTDFSKNAMNAITYALLFLKQQEVQFYIMNACKHQLYNYNDVVTDKMITTVLRTIKNESQQNLENVLHTIKEIAPNSKFTFHTISSNNTLVEEANTIADEKNIDLIVMGTKGKSNNRNMVFGSQTFQVLKYVCCPVLAIPINYTNTQPERILFPSNFLMPYKVRELKLLALLAKLNQSHIELLYISISNKLSRRQEQNSGFIKEALQDNTVQFSIKNGEKLEETIANYVKEKNIDMITMVNTKHSFLEDMLFPSTIDNVGLELEIPLLAMQNTLRY